MLIKTEIDSSNILLMLDDDDENDFPKWSWAKAWEKLDFFYYVLHDEVFWFRKAIKYHFLPSHCYSFWLNSMASSHVLSQVGGITWLTRAFRYRLLGRGRSCRRLVITSNERQFYNSERITTLATHLRKHPQIKIVPERHAHKNT